MHREHSTEDKIMRRTAWGWLVSLAGLVSMDVLAQSVDYRLSSFVYPVRPDPGV